MSRASAAPPPPVDPPARWIEYLPLDDLVGAEVNPKDHDAATIDGSLDEFGYVEPINLDERTGRLVAGNGRLDRLRAKRQAGQAQPPDGIMVRADGAWLIPVARGWASRDDLHARAYLLVSNTASARGGWQAKPLAEYLADLDRDAEDLRRLAFDDADYRQLVVDQGVLADRESQFLDGPDSGAGDDAPAPAGMIRQGSDVVDLRLAMADRERDEAVALLRQHQRALGSPTLSAACLTVLRTWTAPA